MNNHDRKKEVRGIDENFSQALLVLVLNDSSYFLFPLFLCGSTSFN